MSEEDCCAHMRAQDPSLGALPVGLSFTSRRWKKKKSAEDEVRTMLQMRCPDCNELFLIVSEQVCELPCGDPNCLKIHFHKGNRVKLDSAV